ncbi:hypothetical protein BDF19DRAFT_444416 [Syncephalis fuscata]|nr:hypothetical protein BDF19DRAFT_444416 [Syncephalis fuscata]
MNTDSNGHGSVGHTKETVASSSRSSDLDKSTPPSSNSTSVEEKDKKESNNGKSKANGNSKEATSEADRHNTSNESSSSSSNKTADMDSKAIFNGKKHNLTDIDSSSTSGNSSEKLNPADTMDPSHPPGRLVMTEPQARENYTPRYRLGETITFKWKYDDNLRFPPKNLTILVAGPDRHQVTLAANISGDTTEYKWDTNTWDDAKSGPLLEYGRYQLIIFDERGKDALPDSGRLLVYRGTTFGLSNAGGRLSYIYTMINIVLINLMY